MGTGLNCLTEVVLTSTTINVLIKNKKNVFQVLLKIFIVSTHWNRLGEVVLMSTHYVLVIHVLDKNNKNCMYPCKSQF